MTDGCCHEDGAPPPREAGEGGSSAAASVATTAAAPGWDADAGAGPDRLLERLIMGTLQSDPRMAHVRDLWIDTASRKAELVDTQSLLEAERARKRVRLEESLDEVRHAAEAAQIQHSAEVFRRKSLVAAVRADAELMRTRLDAYRAEANLLGIPTSGDQFREFVQSKEHNAPPAAPEGPSCDCASAERLVRACPDGAVADVALRLQRRGLGTGQAASLALRWCAQAVSGGSSSSKPQDTVTVRVAGTQWVVPRTATAALRRRAATQPPPRNVAVALDTECAVLDTGSVAHAVAFVAVDMDTQAELTSRTYFVRPTTEEELQEMREGAAARRPRFGVERLLTSGTPMARIVSDLHGLLHSPDFSVRVLVGYNLAHDLRALSRRGPEASLVVVPPDLVLFDPMLAGPRRDASQRWLKRTEMCDRLGLPNNAQRQQHLAMCDAKDAARLYFALRDRVPLYDKAPCETAGLRCAVGGPVDPHFPAAHDGSCPYGAVDM